MARHWGALCLCLDSCLLRAAWLQHHTNCGARSSAASFRGVLLSSGALAELGSTLGSNLSDYVPKVLPVLFRELRCDDPGNRRNAAYCAGVLCQHAPQQMQSQIGQLLQV